MGFTERSREPRGRYLTTIGRLKPGLTVQGAQAEMARHHGRAHAEVPGFDTGWSARVVPMHQQVTGTIRPRTASFRLGAVEPRCTLDRVRERRANLAAFAARARRPDAASWPCDRRLVGIA